MKQIIAFLVFWISFLSCQSEEINIYTCLLYTSDAADEL